MKRSAAILTVTVVLACLYETFTKGWLSLVLVPASAVVLPLYAVLIRLTSRRSNAQDRITRGLSIALTVSLLAVYIFTPAFGDTKDTLLFGFYSTATDSAITVLSSILAVVSVVLIPILLIATTAWLVAAKNRAKDTSR